MKYLKTKLFFLLSLFTYSLLAQTILFDINNLDKEIPIDPTVTIGKLENGLTYYLQKNTKLENKAELRLVINAGAILEDEDQLGLAHFVEHMAFNGTKNFKKNDLIDYLQSIGVEFGADLNAHTSFDETVYKLSVPTDDIKIFNTSLQVLRDWADGITFDHVEIDNERGIVAEELRARSGAGMRMYYKSIPVLTNNSRYAKRAPIGTLDIIMNSEYDALKRFYRDWYRPDLMALVLVGDFDIAETEKKIKKIFGSLTPVENPRERILYSIPKNTAPAIAIITDAEAQGVRASIYYKKQKKEIQTLKDYRQSLLQKLYTGMLRQRLSEVELLPDAPFLSARAGIGTFLGNMNSYYLSVSLKEDKVSQGIEALLEESERAKRYGFSKSELERYKALLLNNADIYRKEVGKISSRYYLEQYIDNFMDNKPIPGDAFKYQFYKQVLPKITVDEVNKIGEQWIKRENIAVVINAPGKESLVLPSKNEVVKMLNSVTSKKMNRYNDSLGDIKLMDFTPKSGNIVETSYNDKIDVTTWKLSNGITVIIKPTQLQNDLISMNAFRSGGSSVVPDSLYVSARNAGNIIGSSGINNISKINLKKLNMGKTVSVTPYINFYDDLFSGSTSSANLERMLQMTYLYFTAPNKDKSVFEAKKARAISITKNAEANPSAVFDTKISEIMTKNHLRAVPLKKEQIEEELQLDKVYHFYKNRFSSANGFTFIFVGNVELDTIRNLVTQYLGGLPSNLKEQSTWRDIGLRYTKGIIKKTIVKGIDDKSKVDMRFTDTLDFSPDKKKQLSLLAKLLKIKLTEEMREKMSGVYGVQVSGFASDRPYDWYRMNIRFTCAPKNTNKLIAKVFEEIEKIKTNGASQADLEKIKEAELANAKEGLKYNSYWSYKLKNAYEYSWNPENILNYEAEINKLTSNYFKEAANTYFDNNNYAEFILMPEKKN